MNLNLHSLESPWVILLIGPPLSGKTFFINNTLSEMEFDLISRDEILLNVYGSDNYDMAFKNVNQKEVNKKLLSSMQDSANSKNNAIVDMTNMTRKRRKHTLSFFGDDYQKIAILFPILSDIEYENRNKKRMQSENKSIPINVLKGMISSYQTIVSDEGFDQVISLK